jgi:hypothetical protein
MRRRRRGCGRALHWSCDTVWRTTQRESSVALDLSLCQHGHEGRKRRRRDVCGAFAERLLLLLRSEVAAAAATTTTTTTTTAVVVVVPRSCERTAGGTDDVVPLKFARGGEPRWSVSV